MLSIQKERQALKKLYVLRKDIKTQLQVFFLKTSSPWLEETKMENRILRMIMEEIKNKEDQYDIIFLYFEYYMQL